MTKPSQPFSDTDLMAHLHGKAAADLSRAIEAEAQADPAFRAELAMLRGLLEVGKDPDGMTPPGELEWRRLETAIRAEAPQTGSQSEPQSQPHAPHPAANTNAPGRVWLWRVAAVAFGLATLGQAAWHGLPGLGGQPGPDGAEYRTASEDAASPHVLGIVFAPEATMAEVSQLLSKAGARLVDGPGASGIFRAAFQTEDARQAGLSLLRGSPLVALVAEE